MKFCISACFIYDDSLKVDMFELNSQIDDLFRDHVIKRNKVPIKYERSLLPDEVLKMLTEYMKEIEED